MYGPAFVHNREVVCSMQVDINFDVEICTLFRGFCVFKLLGVSITGGSTIKGKWYFF